MRITKKQLRQIIREEMRRDIQQEGLLAHCSGQRQRELDLG